jgi:hypothetical protein
MKESFNPGLKYNTDGAIKIISSYQNFGTVTNPATVIRSIGLPAIALLAAFFAVPFIKCNLDLKLIRHLLGLSHLDKFTWTRNLTSIYLDWQKTRQPLTDGNSYHRAVCVLNRLN